MKPEEVIVGATLLFIAAVFGSILLAGAIRSLIHKYLSFDMGIDTFDSKGKILGRLGVRSKDATMFVQLPNDPIAQRLLTVLEKHIDNNVPWDAVRLAMSSNASRQFHSLSTSQQVVDFKVDVYGNYLLRFPEKIGLGLLVRRQSLKLDLKDVMATVRKNRWHISSDQDIYTDDTDKVQNTHETYSLRDDDAELKEQLATLHKCVESARKLDYMGNTGVRQIFSIHLNTLEEMLGIYNTLTSSPDRESAKKDILECIKMIVHTLTSFLNNYQRGDKDMIANKAASMKAMLETSHISD